MSKLQWDKDAERQFENGIRNGVVYVQHSPFEWDPMVVTDPFTSTSGPYAQIVRANSSSFNPCYPQQGRSGNNNISLTLTFWVPGDPMHQTVYSGSDESGWKWWPANDISEENVLELFQLDRDTTILSFNIRTMMGYSYTLIVPGTTVIPDYPAIGKKYYLRYYPSSVPISSLFGNGVPFIGFPWNGLTSLSESPEGGEPNDQYADDIKYSTLYSKEVMKGTIEAYTYPDAFERCDGSYQIVNGISLHQQPRAPFCLSYKTRLNSSADPDGNGYLLHLLYNCTVSPSEKSYETINDSPDAITFSWDFSTSPTSMVDYIQPSASIVINSTKVDSTKLAALEDILYGKADAGGSAVMPTPYYVCTLLGYKAGNLAKTHTVKLNGGTAHPKRIALYEPLVQGQYTIRMEYNGTYSTNNSGWFTMLYQDGTMYKSWSGLVVSPSRDHISISTTINVDSSVNEFTIVLSGNGQPEDASGVLSYISIVRSSSQPEQQDDDPIEVDIPDDP